METSEAVELALKHARRSSQAIVAKAIGVSPPTLTRWKNGVSPEGRSLEKLLAWAESAPPLPPSQIVSEPEPPPHVVEDAARRTHANLVQFGVLFGIMKSTLRMMRAVVAEQETLVDGFAPWVERAGNPDLSEAWQALLEYDAATDGGEVDQGEESEERSDRGNGQNRRTGQ